MTYATLENALVISRQGFSGGNFTTLQGDTFHYGNALNVTYLNSESVRDYLIVWKCEISDDYYQILDSDWHYYFDYTNDRNCLMYMEIHYGSDYVYGMIFDMHNITYSQREVLHNILNKDYSTPL